MFDFPAAPTLGQPFTPVSGGPAYAWDGTAWRMTSGGISAGVFIGDAPPANPVPGQLWWRSSSGETFIYYSDGTSSQWVQFNVANPSAVRIVERLYTSSDTWTKPNGLQYLEIEALGGGGAGGGAVATSTAQNATGSGGGAGGYGKRIFAASELAASVAVTIGAGGVGVSGTTGAAGGASSFSVCSANGGGGGQASIAQPNTTSLGVSGTIGGSATGFTLNAVGACSDTAIAAYSTALNLVGTGASSAFGQGGRGVLAGSSFAGNAALGFGSGGTGASNFASQAARAGGTGSPGFVRLTEIY